MNNTLLNGNTASTCDYIYVGNANHNIQPLYTSYDFKTILEYMDFMSSIMGLRSYDEYQNMSEEQRENYKNSIRRDLKIDAILNEDR